VTINESQSVDPHLATTLEGRIEGNRGKQPQPSVVEERSVPKRPSPAMRAWKPKVEPLENFL